MADRSIPSARLKAECAQCERDLRALLGTLPADVAAFQPGHAENPERGASGWFTYFRRLNAAHAVAAGHGSTTGQTPRKASADAAAAAALSRQPLTKRSRVPAVDGTPRYLTVYPKSFVVLAHLHGRDMAIARLQPLVPQIYESPAFLPEAARRVLDALADENARCAWIVTTPGVGMPWEPDQPPPALPDDIRALDPQDIAQILAMNLKVNYRRLLLAKPLLTPDPSPTGDALYWSPFFDRASDILGIPSDVLMRDWSLEQLLMTVQLRGSAQRDAEARAEGRADEGIVL